MANEQNLKPFTSEQSREKAAANGKKGGIASGKAKRKRKAFKEALKIALSTVVNDETNATVQDKGIEALMSKFMAGDIKAFEVVRDTVGEKPTEKQEVKVVDSDWFV